MKHNRLLALIPFVLLAVVGCDKSTEGGGDDAAGAEAKATGPCANAEHFAKVAMLEIENTPETSKEGIAFSKQVRGELVAECEAKGLAESHPEVLSCVEKNKGAIGYRVLKGCDEKIARTVIDPVVQRHN